MEQILLKVVTAAILVLFGLFLKMHRDILSRQDIEKMLEDYGDYAEDQKLIMFRLESIEKKLDSLDKKVRNGHG